MDQLRPAALSFQRTAGRGEHRAELRAAARRHRPSRIRNSGKIGLSFQM